MLESLSDSCIEHITEESTPLLFRYLSILVCIELADHSIYLGISCILLLFSWLTNSLWSISLGKGNEL